MPDREKVIYIREIAELDEKKAQRIKDGLLKIARKYEEGRYPNVIIRKNYLGDYYDMVIELKRSRACIGLTDVIVDTKKKTLTGIRTLYRKNAEGIDYRFIRFTFNLNEYRKSWRAWNGTPDIGTLWR